MMMMMMMIKMMDKLKNTFLGFRSKYFHFVPYHGRYGTMVQQRNNIVKYTTYR